MARAKDSKWQLCLLSIFSDCFYGRGDKAQGKHESINEKERVNLRNKSKSHY